MSPFLFAQTPPIEPGVSLELAKWRAAHYSDVRYKLNLTLEKMSPVLKGTMEIRVKVGTRTPPSAMAAGAGDIGTRTLLSATPAGAGDVGTRTLLSATPAGAGDVPPIILDWRKIRGHEEKSTVSNVSINGKSAKVAPPEEPAVADKSVRVPYENEHLIFREGVVVGENVIKLDFTSPILTSGSAITRYVDKEDGAEYIYTLFVPSDASTAFPVFDQPDLKARFTLEDLKIPEDWTAVSNTPIARVDGYPVCARWPRCPHRLDFLETPPISTYVFAFAAGPWEKVTETGGNLSGSEGVSSPAAKRDTLPTGRVSASKSEPPAVAGGLSRSNINSGTTGWRSNVDRSTEGNAEPAATAAGTDTTPRPEKNAGTETSIYVRKSQAAKFKPHAAEVFRLNREAVKYFEQYFDYKFPFPKYDLVLIPEFPFGGMEHAGATFLRESSIIFPQEPTKNDHISRATLIFHEAAHQWFGDTVTMRWFDDLWLKEGFATFMAYKAMEKIMPEMNAWKVFYERVKQSAYRTDSTRGTTAIYQPIANLSAAKSAYGAIVYNKAPAFLRQAEFYLGEDKFQTAVRAFLTKHEFGNAGWEDLLSEFEAASGQELTPWGEAWIRTRGGPRVKSQAYRLEQYSSPSNGWQFKTQIYWRDSNGNSGLTLVESKSAGTTGFKLEYGSAPAFVFPNYGDYGYGIFLLDEKSRDYVLKNIQNEKDPFLRSMMWGALWDSVREGELDPRMYVELVVKVLDSSSAKAENHPVAEAATPLLRKEGSRSEDDESTIALLLNRVGTAMNFYVTEPPALAGGLPDAVALKRPAANAAGIDLHTRVEDMLIERMRNAATLGQRITYYRAFLNIAASDKARGVLKGLLRSEPRAVATGFRKAPREKNPVAIAPGSDLPLKTKDKFDIVTRLLILGDPDAAKLLAELEKAETSDDAKRYAYAAKAGIGTAENKAKYWNDFINNKQISESWIEAAFGPWNSLRHSDLTLPYLQKALQELPNHKRSRKIFFVNGWLGAFIGGQRSEEALGVVNKFLAENPDLDNDLRLKILENVDLIERAVKIRNRFP
ncbi:MAG: M1 family aminopeptidase [Pyrinomonadaceae bacterium]